MVGFGLALEKGTFDGFEPSPSTQARPRIPELRSVVKRQIFGRRQSRFAEGRGRGARDEGNGRRAPHAKGSTVRIRHVVSPRDKIASAE